MRMSDQDEVEMTGRGPPVLEQVPGFHQCWEFRKVWSTELTHIINENNASPEELGAAAIFAAIPVMEQLQQGNAIVVKPLSVEIRQEEGVDLRVEIIGVRYKPGLGDGNMGKRWRLVCENQLARYLLPLMCSTERPDLLKELIVVINGVVNESSHQIWMDKENRRTTVIIVASHPPSSVETQLYRKGSCDNQLLWIHNLPNRKILVVTPLPPLTTSKPHKPPCETNGTSIHRCNIKKGKDCVNGETTFSLAGAGVIVKTPVKTVELETVSDSDSEEEMESQEMEQPDTLLTPVSKTCIGIAVSPALSNGSKSSIEIDIKDAEESSECIMGPSDNEANPSPIFPLTVEETKDTLHEIEVQAEAYNKGKNSAGGASINGTFVTSGRTTTPLKTPGQNIKSALREVVTPDRDSGALTARDSSKKIVSSASKQVGLQIKRSGTVSLPIIELSDSSSDGDFGTTATNHGRRTRPKSSNKHAGEIRKRQETLKLISPNAHYSEARNSSKKVSEAAALKPVRRNISAELEELPSETSSDADFGLSAIRSLTPRKNMLVYSDSSDAEAETKDQHTKPNKTRRLVHKIPDDSSDEGIEKCRTSSKPTTISSENSAKQTTISESSEDSDQETDTVPRDTLLSPRENTQKSHDSDDEKNSDGSSETVVITVNRKYTTSVKSNSQTVAVNDTAALSPQEKRFASPKFTEAPRSQCSTNNGGMSSISSDSSKSSGLHSSKKEKALPDTAGTAGCKKRLKFGLAQPLRCRKGFETHEFDSSDEDEGDSLSAKKKKRQNRIIEDDSDEHSDGMDSAKKNTENNIVEKATVINDRPERTSSKTSIAASPKISKSTLNVSKSPRTLSVRDLAGKIIRRVRSASSSESESVKRSPAPKKIRRVMSASSDSSNSSEHGAKKKNRNIRHLPKIGVESDESTVALSTPVKKAVIDPKNISEAEQRRNSPSRLPKRRNLTPQITPKRFPVEIYKLSGIPKTAKSTEKVSEDDEVDTSSVGKTTNDSQSTSKSNMHRGSEAEMISMNNKSYEKIKDLEEQLGTSRSPRALTKRNVYGIVEEVIKMAIADTEGYCRTTKDGTYELRISDETKSSVFTRICSMSFKASKPTVQMMAGPVMKNGDIIRIHRATVQFEKLNNGLELVISTSPHLNYTLFENRLDDFEAPLEPCRRLATSKNPVSSVDVSIVSALRRHWYEHLKNSPAKRSSSRNANSMEKSSDISKSLTILEYASPEKPIGTPKKQPQISPKKSRVSHESPDEPMESQATVIDENAKDCILNSASEEEMEVADSPEPLNEINEELPVLKLESNLPIPRSGYYEIGVSTPNQRLHITRLEDIFLEDETITYNFFVKVVDMEILKNKDIMLLRVRDGTMPSMNFQTMLLEQSPEDALDIEVRNISTNHRLLRTVTRHLHEVMILKSVRRLTELRGCLIKLVASIDDVMILNE